MNSKSSKEIMTKLMEHDAHFSEIDRRLDQHDARFDKIDARFERSEEATHQLGIKFENLESSVKLVLDVVLATQEKLEKYDTLDKQVTDHGHRIAAVEHFISRHPD